jgi:hypothetical protein
MRTTPKILYERAYRRMKNCRAELRDIIYGGSSRNRQNRRDHSVLHSANDASCARTADWQLPQEPSWFMRARLPG